MLTIFRLYRNYRPLRFFGSLALVMALISMAMFLPILFEYMSTGLVPRQPTLIVSGLLMLSALLSLSSGLILENNAIDSRKNLEVQMNIITLLLPTHNRLKREERRDD